jgi:hypothetical protein
VAGCTSLIVFLNVVTLLIGLLVTAFGIWLLVGYYNQQATATVAVWAVWIPFIIGVVLSLVALVGCCTTLHENRFCIGCYAILQLVFGVVLVVVGSFLIVAPGYIYTVSTTPPAQLQPGFANSQRELSDVTQGVWVACCQQIAASGVTACVAGSNQANCWWSQSTFNVGAGTQQSVCNSYAIPGSACSSASTFQSWLYTSTSGAAKGSGIAFVVFGSVLLIAFFGSCYIACCAPSGKRAPEHKSGAPQYAQSNQMAMA